MRRHQVLTRTITLTPLGWWGSDPVRRKLVAAGGKLRLGARCPRCWGKLAHEVLPGERRRCPMCGFRMEG